MPSLERSYGPEQVKDALGFAPAGPVNFGQVIPGFGGLVSIIFYRFNFPVRGSV